ncbi:UNVERIFIED_CONTAM: hypothetical protein GTU68_013763, partial [Idotea baltica]|nr:hypothetical protein [Idotea baltica]
TTEFIPTKDVTPSTSKPRTESRFSEGGQAEGEAEPSHLLENTHSPSPTAICSASSSSPTRTDTSPNPPSSQSPPPSPPHPPIRPRPDCFGEQQKAERARLGN